MPAQPEQQATDHLFTCEVCIVCASEDTHPTIKMVWTIVHTLIGDLMHRAEGIMRAEQMIEGVTAFGQMVGFNLMPPESEELYRKSVAQFQMIIESIEQLVVDTGQALHPLDRKEVNKLKLWKEGN